MSSVHVLVVDDDVKIARLLRRVLTANGYVVLLCASGDKAQVVASSKRFFTSFCSIGCSRIDGLAVCRSLREQGVETPIIMLTARDGVGERIAGLDAGANDYLVKPFALDELLARVRAVVRRAGMPLSGWLAPASPLRRQCTPPHLMLRSRRLRGDVEVGQNPRVSGRRPGYQPRVRCVRTCPKLLPGLLSGSDGQHSVCP